MKRWYGFLVIMLMLNCPTYPMYPVYSSEEIEERQQPLDELELDQLLVEGCRQRIVEDEESYTALHHAAFYGSEGACDLLLNNGFNLHALVPVNNDARFNKDMFHAQPLDMAIASGKEEVVILLLTRGARIDKKSRSAPQIYQAIKSANPKIIRALITHGADCNHFSYSGYESPLEEAIKLEQGMDIIELIYSRTDKKVFAKIAEKCLCQAAFTGHIGATIFLLSLTRIKEYEYVPEYVMSNRVDDPLYEPERCELSHPFFSAVTHDHIAIARLFLKFKVRMVLPEVLGAYRVFADSIFDSYLSRDSQLLNYDMLSMLITTGHWIPEQIVNGKLVPDWEPCYRYLRDCTGNVLPVSDEEESIPSKRSIEKKVITAICCLKRFLPPSVYKYILQIDPELAFLYIVPLHLSHISRAEKVPQWIRHRLAEAVCHMTWEKVKDEIDK